MARKPSRQQRSIDFPALAADARAAFIERNNELRSKLRSIEVSLTGLSRRRWEHVCEVLMSAWVHTTTSKTTQATTRLVATSGLSADQYHRARREALRLGLAVAVRSYAGTIRKTDRLDIDIGEVDRLLAETQVLKRQKLRPTAPQLRPSALHIKEDYMRASDELPKKPTTSSAIEPEKASEEEVFLEKLIAECRRLDVPLPTRFKTAARTAIASGLSFEQVWQRCKWFHANQGRWPTKYLRGALHDGLVDATPDLPASEGWPYQTGQCEVRR